ncbi:HD domain protein, cyanamide hydratase family [Roseibium album]|nr:HD domain protein, cyanamide hydratase family [Roseibium album]
MITHCEVSESGSKMGTIEWGKRAGAFSKGRLTRIEKLRILINMGRMTALEAMDTLLDRSGLMDAFGSDLEGMQPPDTALVRDAFDFADDVQGLELMRHSWRSYYWAMLLGGYRKLEVDREILFAAAILHDVGLAKGRNSEPRECCFVVYGVERCKHHLVGKGHDRAKVKKIADAIGLHLNAYVSDRVSGIEAHLLSRGAMCDVFGMGRKRIAKSIHQQVLTEYPKGDLFNELEIWPGHHLSGTRGDFLISLGSRKRKSAQGQLLTQSGE